MYAQFDFNEPWDSDTNQGATDNYGKRGPRWYMCPSDMSPDSGRPITTKVMIVGDRTASPGRTGRAPAEFKRGLSQTVFVTEVVNSGINWMEPRDMSFADMSFTVNDARRTGVSSRHPGGALVTMADGSVRFLVDSTDPDVVRRMLTVSDDEADAK